MSAPLEMRDVVAGRGGRVVIAGASLAVAAGEVVGLVGANGAGKTTLLRVALGLTPARRGQSMLGGEDVRRLSDPARAARAAYLPQERRLAWNLAAWRVAALGAPQRSPQAAREAALAALAAVGMGGQAERGVLDLSGGERARVLLARLMVTQAPLLLADEPAAGLDPDAQLMIMELLRARAAAGAAVLVTIHDLTLAARSCNRVAVLAGGRLIADAPPRLALSSAALREAFGLQGGLIESPAGLLVAAGRAGYRS